MKTLGNILWFIFIGLWSAIIWFLHGAFLCITIIGIPFGLQVFKIARLISFPFGKVVKSDFGKHPIANILWLLFGGLEHAVSFLIVGVIFYITIIGIPFGKQCFKLASLAAVPFGANV